MAQSQEEKMKIKKNYIIIFAIIIALVLGLYYFFPEPLFWEKTSQDAGGVHATLDAFLVFPEVVSIGDTITVVYSITNDGTDDARYIDICLLLDWNGNEQRDDFDHTPNQINCPFFPTGPSTTHENSFELTVSEDWVDPATNEIPLCLYANLLNENTGGWYEFGQSFPISILDCEEGTYECRGEEYYECVNGQWVRNSSNDGECLSSQTALLTVNTNPNDCIVSLSNSNYADVNISTNGQYIFEAPKGTYTLEVQKSGYKPDIRNVELTEDQTVSVTLERQSTPGFETLIFLIAMFISVILLKRRNFYRKS